MKSYNELEALVIAWATQKGIFQNGTPARQCDKTLEEVSEMIGISKSTTFLNTKRVKLHLKSILKNPFKPDNE
jgi:hypothetical protein